jgi:ABC-type Fe3+-citrate transport system substrate-binding protein
MEQSSNPVKLSDDPRWKALHPVQKMHVLSRLGSQWARKRLRELDDETTAAKKSLGIIR